MDEYIIRNHMARQHELQRERNRDRLAQIALQGKPRRRLRLSAIYTRLLGLYNQPRTSRHHPVPIEPVFKIEG
ncbi:MAG: hypothetical protein K8L99_23765 [Anaerolineae bacterium]|nr:hypothetical protein [Anaerolineae bacterium]